MKGVNVIESIEETRLERGRRLRKERRKQWGMLTVTAMTAFSTTILLGHENTRLTNSLFTAEVANASSVGAAANFCAEDTHRNGDKHKPHPPGNGYGHCKPHDNNGGGNDGRSVTEEIPDPPPEENTVVAPEEIPDPPPEENNAPAEPVSYAPPFSSMPAPAEVHLQRSTTPPALA